MGLASVSLKNKTRYFHMTHWKNNYSAPSVTRELNVLSIHRLDHAKAASDFKRVLAQGIYSAKYTAFEITFDEISTTFPNAIVPIACIIDSLREKGVEFTFNNVPSFLQNTEMLQPKLFENNSRHILNTVWKFSSSDEVGKLVRAYIQELQKSAHFYKGMLNSIEWSLYEVMDNVIQHSKVGIGYVMGQIHQTAKQIAFTVSDMGQGIYNSLKQSDHNPRNPVDAITLAIREEVTRDKSIGQGNGLFGLHSIVKQGHGKLAITSDSGSYCYYTNNPKTYSDLPRIAADYPGTIVDFQLGYDKDMSLDKALVFRGQVYNIVNINYDEFEDEFGRIVYSIADRAEGTGTRESAIRVKNELFNILVEQQKPITIDFSGVEVMSSSFADELLAKLLLELGLFQFNNLIKIKGLDKTQQSILHRSVIQRMKEIVQ